MNTAVQSGDLSNSTFFVAAKCVYRLNEVEENRYRPMGRAFGMAARPLARLRQKCISTQPMAMAAGRPNQ